MTLHLAHFVKYEAKTPEEQKLLEDRIRLLSEHIAFEGNVTPLEIDDKTGKIRNQFLARWRNESVQILPIGGKLPDYKILSAQGKDDVVRMLNVHDTPEYAWISLRADLQEQYKHYYLFRKPELS